MKNQKKACIIVMIVIALSFLIGAHAIAQTINITKNQNGYVYVSPGMRGAAFLIDSYQFREYYNFTLNYGYAISVLYHSRGRLLWALPDLLRGDYNSPAYSVEARSDKLRNWDSPYPRRPHGGETGFIKHGSQ